MLKVAKLLAEEGSDLRLARFINNIFQKWMQTELLFTFIYNIYKLMHYSRSQVIQTDVHMFKFMMSLFFITFLWFLRDYTTEATFTLQAS